MSVCTEETALPQALQLHHCAALEVAGKTNQLVSVVSVVCGVCIVQHCAKNSAVLSTF